MLHLRNNGVQNKYPTDRFYLNKTPATWNGISHPGRKVAPPQVCTNWVHGNERVGYIRP